MDIPRLVSATALDDYILLLEYDNGESRSYDFKPNLSHPFYRQLENMKLFKTVYVTDGEIGWVSGQDFCPHTLYLRSSSEEL